MDAVTQDILLLEYTEIMLGNKTHFSDDFFSGNSPASEEKVIDFVRLVAKVYLQCTTAQQAKLIFTQDMIRKMHLLGIIKEIRVPDFIDAHDRMDFITAKIFSKNLNAEKWAAEHYCNRVLDGSLVKFPRNYMDGEVGYSRACYCLRYFLKLEKPGASALDLLYMSVNPKFRAWLQSHYLLNVCGKYFDSRVDFMYEALPEDMKIDILFMLCKTRYLFDKTTAELS